MKWPSQPSIRGAGDLNKPERAKHYANPPSSPGLRGFMLHKKPGERGHEQSIGTGTAYSLTRKNEPFR